jgi:YYY domain-containing protein
MLLRRWDRLPRLLALRRLFVIEEDEAGAVVLVLAVTALVAAGVLAALGMALVGVLLVLFLLVVALALRRGPPVEESFILLLFAVGLALGIATELVAIDGDVGRMNTVFKFYMQVWVLWSVAAAAGLARSWDWLTGARSREFKRAWLGVLGVLVLFAAVYPVVGTWARVRDRFDPSIPPTLDGTAYMATSTYSDDGRPLRLASDLEAIRWLQDNVAGSPVILEGQTPLYRWGSRVSIYTGLPTVIGWDWHQKQQRWGYQDQVDQRGADVRAMYSDASVERTVALLRQYHVAYVYVGDLERAYYPAAGLAKLDRMVGQYLEVAYDQDGVRIYRVINA